MKRKKLLDRTFEENFKYNPNASSEEADDINLPIDIKGYKDNPDMNNSIHRAKKASDLHRDSRYDEYQKLLESATNEEDFLNDVKRIQQFEERNDMDIGDLSMSILKSKKAKEDWKKAGFGKNYEKEEEVEKEMDSGPGMFSKIIESITGPSAAEVTTDQLKKKMKK